MINNTVLRRIRYIFKLSDPQMVTLFQQGGLELTRDDVVNLLRKDDDPELLHCNDQTLSQFLDGFIVSRRGPAPAGARPEPRLSNNQILRKLKIALQLTSDDILQILKLADFRFSRSELSALFRHPDHKHYRACKDQLLRNFLLGLQCRFRPDSAKKESAPASEPAETEVPKASQQAAIWPSRIASR